MIVAWQAGMFGRYLSIHSGGTWFSLRAQMPMVGVVPPGCIANLLAGPRSSSSVAPMTDANSMPIRSGGMPLAEPRVLHGELTADHAELDRPGHRVEVRRYDFDQRLWPETRGPRRPSATEVFWVDVGDGADAGRSGEERLPGGVGAGPDRADDAEPGQHGAAGVGRHGRHTRLGLAVASAGVGRRVGPGSSPTDPYPVHPSERGCGTHFLRPELRRPVVPDPGEGRSGAVSAAAACTAFEQCMESGTVRPVLLRANRKSHRATAQGQADEEQSSGELSDADVCHYSLFSATGLRSPQQVGELAGEDELRVGRPAVTGTGRRGRT